MGENQKSERRSFVVELRAEARAEGGEKRKLVGYAAVFDSPADLGYYTEVIRPGAFTEAIKEGDVRALFNHNDNFVLGRTKSGTLNLSEDQTGLRVEIDPPETQWANDLLVTIDRGDVDQMSFAFRVKKEAWTRSEDGNHLREILKVDLYDVSPVTYPAYEDTEISLRKLDPALLTDEARTALAQIDERSADASATGQDEPAVHQVTDSMRRRLQLAERS